MQAISIPIISAISADGDRSREAKTGLRWIGSTNESLTLRRCLARGECAAREPVGPASCHAVRGHFSEQKIVGTCLSVVHPRHCRGWTFAGRCQPAVVKNPKTTNSKGSL